jgi:hypothetical protein
LADLVALRHSAGILKVDEVTAFKPKDAVAAASLTGRVTKPSEQQAKLVISNVGIGSTTHDLGQRLLPVAHRTWIKPKPLDKLRKIRIKRSLFHNHRRFFPHGKIP